MGQQSLSLHWDSNIIIYMMTGSSLCLGYFSAQHSPREGRSGGPLWGPLQDRKGPQPKMAGFRQVTSLNPMATPTSCLSQRLETQFTFTFLSSLGENL